MVKKRNVIEIVIISATDFYLSETLINQAIERQFENGYKVLSTSPITGWMDSQPQKNKLLSCTVGMLFVFELIEP